MGRSSGPNAALTRNAFDQRGPSSRNRKPGDTLASIPDAPQRRGAEVPHDGVTRWMLEALAEDRIEGRTRSGHAAGYRRKRATAPTTMGVSGLVQGRLISVLQGRFHCSTNELPRQLRWSRESESNRRPMDSHLPAQSISMNAVVPLISLATTSSARRFGLSQAGTKVRPSGARSPAVPSSGLPE